MTKNHLATAIAHLSETDALKGRCEKMRDQGYDRETIQLILDGHLEDELQERILDMVFDNPRQRLAKLEMEVVRAKENKHGKRRSK